MKKEVIMKIENYQNNLRLAEDGRLPFAVIFISSAIEFLQKEQVLSYEDEEKLKVLLRECKKQDDKINHVKISAQLNEDKFLKSLIKPDRYRRWINN